MRFIENMPLSQATSLRIGGPARLYCRPGKKTQALDAISAAREKGLALLILGRGTNLLVSDRGVDALVIDMNALSAFEREGDCIIAQAGALFHHVIKSAVEQNLRGLENCAGIPGTIGGGVIMNAGAFGQEIADTLLWADYIDLNTLRQKRAYHKDCALGYRTSVFKEQNALVWSASLRFAPCVDPEFSERFRAILQRRTARQPLELPNCGSVFKRPAGDYAGRLIEKHGLKGLRVGNAMVSPKHANFIVNRGGARAEEVRKCIAIIQQRVFEAEGVLLEPEVLFWGEFEQPLYTPA
jgi:UDP-N-acetylmuramate dehydrogenase